MFQLVWFRRSVVLLDLRTSTRVCGVIVWHPIGWPEAAADAATGLQLYLIEFYSYLL